MLQTRSTLAVMDDHYFYANRQSYFNAVPHEPIETCADLFDLIEESGFTHVWIVPETKLSQFAGDYQGNEWLTKGIGGETWSFVSIRREGQRHEDARYVAFPEFSGWPWREDSNPKTLLATLTYLEDALGMPLEWSAAHMSLQYVRKLNLERWGWWQPLTTDLEQGTPGFSYEKVAREINWQSPGQAESIQQDARFLVKIDCNSAYAAAMIGLKIGEGNPKWTCQGATAYDYDGKRPGFWLVRLEQGNSPWNGQQLPRFDPLWATTDQIEQWRNVGFVVEIQVGWYWEKYHTSLRSTAESLWNLRTLWRARAAKSPAHENTYETIRVVLKAVQGAMARKGAPEHFRRRDIWAAVTARSVALMMYRVEKIHNEFGLWPIAIKVDELTYAVNDPNIFDAMLGTEKLGGFKLVGSELIEHLV